MDTGHACGTHTYKQTKLIHKKFKNSLKKNSKCWQRWREGRIVIHCCLGCTTGPATVENTMENLKTKHQNTHDPALSLSDVAKDLAFLLKGQPFIHPL